MFTVKTFDEERKELLEQYRMELDELAKKEEKFYKEHGIILDAFSDEQRALSVRYNQKFLQLMKKYGKK